MVKFVFRKHWEMYKDPKHGEIDPKVLEFPRSSPAMAYFGPESPVRFVEKEGWASTRSEENFHAVRNMSLKGYGELIRGYRAGVTFLDDQVGRLLDALDKHNLWNNTVVLLTADHGMHLGERGMWQKWTLFEESTRVPLMIHDPAHPDFYGKRYSGPVESLDIYPTLVELTGMTFDTNCDGPECTPFEGKSLASIVRGQPTHNHAMDFAITQKLTCRRKKAGDAHKDFGWSLCGDKSMTDGAIGYALRTSDWRYVAWFRFDLEKYKPIITPNSLFAEELYDHRGEDPHRYQPEMESESLVHNPSFHNVVKAHRNKLLHFLSSYDNWFPKYKEYKHKPSR